MTMTLEARRIEAGGLGFRRREKKEKKKDRRAAAVSLPPLEKGKKRCTVKEAGMTLKRKSKRGETSPWGEKKKGEDSHVKEHPRRAERKRKAVLGYSSSPT